MDFDERELKKLLNREKVECVKNDSGVLYITTEDKVITISATIVGVKFEIENREFIE